MPWLLQTALLWTSGHVWLFRLLSSFFPDVCPWVVICSSVKALLPAFRGGCPGRFPASRVPGPSLLSPPALGGQALTQSSGQLATPCPCSPALTSFMMNSLPEPIMLLSPGCAGSLLSGVPPPCSSSLAPPSGWDRAPASAPCPGQSAPQWLGPFPRASRPLSCLPLAWSACIALPVCDLPLTSASGWRPDPTRPAPRTTVWVSCPVCTHEDGNFCSHDSQPLTSDSGS